MKRTEGLDRIIPRSCGRGEVAGARRRPHSLLGSGNVKVCPTKAGRVHRAAAPRAFVDLYRSTSSKPFSGPLSPTRIGCEYGSRQPKKATELRATKIL